MCGSPSMPFCTGPTNVETPAEIFISGDTFYPPEAALRPLAHFPKSSKKLQGGKDWKSKKEFVIKALSTWNMKAILHTATMSEDWTYCAEKFPTFHILCKKVCNENRRRDKNKHRKKGHFKIQRAYSSMMLFFFFFLWQANHSFFQPL